MPKRGLLPVVYLVVVDGDGGGGDSGDGGGVAVPVVASLPLVEEVASEFSQVRVTESAPSLMLSELPLTYFVVALVSELAAYAHASDRANIHTHIDTSERARAGALTQQSRDILHTLAYVRAFATAYCPSGRSTREARHNVRQRACLGDVTRSLRALPRPPSLLPSVIEVII